MISRHSRIKTISIILFVAIAASFCASKNFLVVNYQLPVQPEILSEPSVSLVIKDSREDPAFASRTAKKVLKDFQGDFVLYKNNELMGAFSLPSLIREIFKHRLENAGLHVAAEEQSRDLVVEITLKTFKLDFVERKWIVDMTYQANLLKQDRFAAGETITGSAERLRVAGNKDAEKLIGELITDVVNRMNLQALFKSNQI